MNKKIGKKVHYMTAILLVLVIFINIVNVCAETISPEISPIATPTPTPVPNIIKSIGDFKLFARYEDERIVDENLSINVKIESTNNISSEIIQSVRAQEGDKDIFLYFHISLQMNGRDIPLESNLNIYIENSGIFANYQDYSLFKITGESVAKQKNEVKDGYISFNTNEMGYYLLAGVSAPNSSQETAHPESTPTLQNNETAGIISPSSKVDFSDEENGQITPGAFVFWMLAALMIGLWIGLGIGYILWGRYKTKKAQRGPYVIGEQ